MNEALKQGCPPTISSAPVLCSPGFLRGYGTEKRSGFHRPGYGKPDRTPNNGKDVNHATRDIHTRE